MLYFSNQPFIDKHNAPSESDVPKKEVNDKDSKTRISKYNVPLTTKS